MNDNELESLALDECYVTTLSKYLRLCAHLRKVKISLIADRDWHQVVKAVKKNGSLHKVSWVHEPSSYSNLYRNRSYPRKPGRQYRRHLKAIGRRNRFTPKLLANPRHDRQHDNTDASAKTTAAVENFPTLFLASMDAERTAPNMLLIGLLATTPTASVDRGQGQQKLLRPLTQLFHGFLLRDCRQAAVDTSNGDSSMDVSDTATSSATALGYIVTGRVESDSTALDTTSTSKSDSDMSTSSTSPHDDSTADDEAAVEKWRRKIQPKRNSDATTPATVFDAVGIWGPDVLAWAYSVLSVTKPWTQQTNSGWNDSIQDTLREG